MPVRRHYAISHRWELRQEFAEILEEPAQRAANQIKRIVTQILDRTLQFSSQFGTVGFRDANVKVEKTVRVTARNGIEINMQVLVVDEGGNPHFIWHIISFGRATFRQRRTSPPIRARKGLRTTPNTLSVKKFPGYKGEWFVIPAGTIVAGIPPRRWYEAAVRMLRIEIKKYPTLQVLGIELSHSEIRKP